MLYSFSIKKNHYFPLFIIIVFIVDNNQYLFSGTQMLALLVPTLIRFLIDVELTKYDTNISKFRYKLHEFSLQCLLKIGQDYPQVNLLCLLY